MRQKAHHGLRPIQYHFSSSQNVGNLDGCPSFGVKIRVVLGTIDIILSMPHLRGVQTAKRAVHVAMSQKQYPDLGDPAIEGAPVGTLTKNSPKLENQKVKRSVSFSWYCKGHQKKSLLFGRFSLPSLECDCRNHHGEKSQRAFQVVWVALGVPHETSACKKWRLRHARNSCSKLLDLGQTWKQVNMSAACSIQPNRKNTEPATRC